ncbi:MAG: zinc-binding dehydrogenase [Acidimicrobiia bacterium]
MHAVTIEDGALRWAERPDPEPGTGEVLVRVRAAGLNGADLHQVKGRYPAPPGWPADVPGMEIAGEVAAAGPGTTTPVGARVMAVVGGGGQAQLCLVPESQLMAVPDAWGWPEAGGFPEVFMTAHDAVFTQAGLGLGERLCVHGAAGGVGVAAVQLGVAAGASVVATVRSPERRDDVAALGATVVAPEDFGDHGPYDVVLELVGATNLGANLAALAVGGRISIIGIGSGTKGELDLRLLMAKRGRIHGSTLRARSLADKALAARALERHVLPLVAGGRIRVPIAATYPLADAAAAYERFAAGSKFGKVVLLDEG